MAKLTFTIDNEKISQIVNDWIYLYPNYEMMDDPENEGSVIPKYSTNIKWVKESIRRFIIKQIEKCLKKYFVSLNL